MFIKICANTSLDDALTAAQLGADAVGFILAPSKRRVTGDQIAKIVDGLPEGVEKVGVFASDDPYEVEHYVVGTGLTMVQLHKPFDPEMVRLLSREFDGEIKIIQTVAYAVDAIDRVASDARFVAALRAVFAEPLVWAVLLDAAKAGASGGLGVAFDWKHVAVLVKEAIGPRLPRPRLILAGGLRPDNVAEAIVALQPWGVDVASGVESAPGKKNWEKLRAFIAAARAAASYSADPGDTLDR